MTPLAVIALNRTTDRAPVGAQFPQPGGLPEVDRPRPEGRVFGKVDIDNAFDPFLISGSRIGRTEGYESLANARRALAVLTRGVMKPAGAAFEFGERFYTTSVNFRGALGGETLPYHAMHTFPGERGVNFDDPRAAALVDDDAVFLNR